MKPVPGKIFQFFGSKWIPTTDVMVGNVLAKAGEDVYKKFFSLDGHNGLDFEASVGTPVVAAFDGFIVSQTDKPTGYGLRIVQRVEKNGKFYAVTYGHLSRLEKDIELLWDWESKYFAKEGQVIGYTGNSGASSGPHLHFGVQPVSKDGFQLEPNNGFGGCIDPLLLISKTMTNAKLVQIGSEMGYWFPAITGDGLKSQAANVGEVLPEKADKSLDWDKIKPDYKI